MSATAQKQEVAAQLPVKAAPVVASGIANVNNKATDKQVEQYCALVVKGKPTGKCFSNKLSEMEFTDAQREMIRLARKTHKENCIKDKPKILNGLRKKGVMIYANRTNQDSTKGRVGWIDKSLFAGKDGKHSPAKEARFIDGPAIKPAAVTA